MNKKFIITDPVGLHARPATLLVNQAVKYVSESKILVENKEANLKSIMGVMSLALANGQIFEIEVKGVDAEEAIKGLEEVITRSDIGEVK